MVNECPGLQAGGGGKNNSEEGGGENGRTRMDFIKGEVDIQKCRVDR